MIKKITLTSFTALVFIGCGGAGGESAKTISGTTQTVQKAYNLWEYIAPQSSKTNTFTKVTDAKQSTYTTTYTVTGDKVEAKDDYAPDEKTIYQKSGDTILVKFEKNNKANGQYSLHMGANIGDIVTVRSSTCKLTQHLDTFSLANQTFHDVIEIKCADTPGYYQKGVGEVGQIEKGLGKSIRVLSN